MTRSQELGSTTVWQTDDHFTILPLGMLDQIYADIISGEEWFRENDINGSRVLIKLSSVVKIDECTPEQWKIRDEENKADALS